jgi:co-chaperonin GroES (HSP10)
MTVQYGVRHGNETLTGIKACEHLRPLRDRIVLEPLPPDLSSTLEVVTATRPVRGRVLAVGPGTHPKRYNGPKGYRSRSWDSKAFRPCDLKVGEIVDIGGLELGGYLHMTVQWGEKTVVVCREEDVAVVIEDG